jgi:hypothetical protein
MTQEYVGTAHDGADGHSYGAGGHGDDTAHDGGEDLPDSTIDEQNREV